MLSQLTIHDFAIVDRLHVEWHPGLNVITGETGAGKSILIDAVGALLGDRLGPEVIRGGARRALVEGVFTVPPEPSPALQAVLDEYGLEPEDGALIVTREMAGGGGRGGARINGRGVPLSILQSVGELLVDVHGQSEHMALLRNREQLDYLDQFAGTLDGRAEIGALVRERRAAAADLAALVSEAREAARAQERLRYELSEIDAAELVPGEEQDLLAQRTRLEHVERLRNSTQVAHAALVGGDAGGENVERPGALDLLSEAVAASHDGGRIDAELGRQAETLEAALTSVDEAARALRAYLDTLEVDPNALERVAERLFVLADLKRKYGESIPEILAYAGGARDRLEALERRADHQAELEAGCQTLDRRLAKVAADVSRRRESAARELAKAVDSELADLRLVGVRFVVRIQRHEPIDATGQDRVDFAIVANRNEDARPIARVASGGELARIALALKTVLSRADERTTLIFDEVDAGVGGRTAPVVGEKLRAVASAGHQVLCVTHMPQVAAYADAHYVVNKLTDSGGSSSSVALVSGDERIEELAAMLSGSATAASRQSARELLTRAVR
ncbi:MAG: DNA repair protein RecN [Chloroflexota bacterium]